MRSGRPLSSSTSPMRTDRKLAQVAAGIESDGYRKWPRVQETILFAKRMGYHKIGIATCVALIRESRTLAKMLRANGFEVFGVGCKTGEIFKTALGIDAAHQGPGPVACNPVLQAQLLNEAGTELNIVMGLCVGHDSLFYKHAQAVTTTLVVKDRVPGPQPRDGPVHRRWVLRQPNGAFGGRVRFSGAVAAKRRNPAPMGAGFFDRFPHRVTTRKGVFPWSSVSPWSRGCSAAGRWGTRAELTMEGPGPGQGLYRGYALGEGGQMNLGPPA